jgi:hypothetical protein
MTAINIVVTSSHARFASGCRHVHHCSTSGSALIACSGLSELPSYEWPEGLLGKGSGANVWSVRLPAGAPVDRFGRRT